MLIPSEGSPSRVLVIYGILYWNHDGDEVGMKIVTKAGKGVNISSVIVLGALCPKKCRTKIKVVVDRFVTLYPKCFERKLK